MLLAELVACADRVAAVASRNAKIAELAGLLERVPSDEVEAAVAFLTGVPRQGKVGAGWRRVGPLLDAVRPAADSTLTIADLDRAMAGYQATTGPGSTEARAAQLRKLLERATVAEAGFVARLLTGELRHGALEGVVADAVARAARVAAETVRRAWMLSGDLAHTAAVALRHGEPGLAAIGLDILTPVGPMLASAAEDLAGAFAGIAEASVEWKLDGIRIQVHRLGPEVRVYTRNLNDVTARLPEIVEVARGLEAERFVLDGEAIALGPGDRPHAFQDIMSRVGRHDGGGELAMVPFFFDVLHVGGDDLVDRPLAARLEALHALAAAWRIPNVVTADPGRAVAFLETALDAGHEGVVVKALDSPYQAGRRGKSWRKVKRAKTLDLVVLGAEWGHGRRRGRLSNLHLGARDPAGGFLMVGKTFKGLTDELLRWQTETFLQLETHREGIVVFVRPELVVEIELDGVQVSPRYPGGVALRFARVKRYRDDKGPHDADTIGAVRALLPG